MKIQLCFALICVCVSGALALTCSTCDLSFCPEIKCRFGVTKDVCNCCPACYKGIGETCGGMFNMDGRCAPHLSCIRLRSDVPVTKVPFDDSEPSRCFALP